MVEKFGELKLSFYQYFYYCSYSQSCICTTVWSWKSILIWFDLILITLKANLRILESNVKTMLYVGSEIWTVTSGLTKKIQSTDNSLRMVILGVCWLNFIQWRRVWQKRWQRSSIKASASFDRYSPKFVLQSFEWVNVMNVWEGPKIATTDNNIARIHQMVWNDGQIKVRDSRGYEYVQRMCLSCI